MIHRNYKTQFGLLCFACILTGAIFVSTIAFAADSPSAEALHDYRRANNGEERLLTLRTYCDAIIFARISAIDSTIAQVVAEGRMENSDKSEITSMLDRYKETLNSSSGSMPAMDDLEMLKELARNVFRENRIFHVVIPKAHGLKTVAKSEYILENDIEKHLVVITKVSEELAKRELDVSDLEKKLALLKDTSTNLAVNLAEARQNFEDMDPASGVSFNTLKLDAAREQLSLVKESLLDAKHQLGQIIPVVESLLASIE